MQKQKGHKHVAYVHTSSGWLTSTSVSLSSSKEFTCVVSPLLIAASSNCYINNSDLMELVNYAQNLDYRSLVGVCVVDSETEVP